MNLGALASRRRLQNHHSQSSFASRFVESLGKKRLQGETAAGRRRLGVPEHVAGNLHGRLHAAMLSQVWVRTISSPFKPRRPQLADKAIGLRIRESGESPQIPSVISCPKNGLDSHFPGLTRMALNLGL